MAASDLATLQNVRAWLGVSDTKSDAVLSRLITAISAQVLSYLSRDYLYSGPRVDTRDGTGTQEILLRTWPVTSVQSVLLDNVAIPQASQQSTNVAFPYGWVLSEWSGSPPGSNQTISLTGWTLTPGKKNVQVNYTAGYLVSGESWLIPSGGSLTAAQPLGSWCQDSGAVFADTGLALVPITSGTPASGQYLVQTQSLVYPDVGTYQFALADVGRPILLSYSYIPAALEQIVIEEVSERYKYRDRIGLRSKSLGGQETMSYDLSGLPAYLRVMLAPWRSVVPILP